ncbi:hypothetical protein Ddye_027330 [Dipteronia dyeriana]|uniref:Uncharacterized protein n=1 Tax=Dipteronia dyeriana TaxID=168575 RepID=A0AAD9TPU5_9ROSI|nr:hypothetical protein Ddye_027330 [Dipteronia dyeriana]
MGVVNRWSFRVNRRLGLGVGHGEEVFDSCGYVVLGRWVGHQEDGFWWIEGFVVNQFCFHGCWQSGGLVFDLVCVDGCVNGLKKMEVESDRGGWDTKKKIKMEVDEGDTCEEIVVNRTVGGHSTFEICVLRRLGR